MGDTVKAEGIAPISYDLEGASRATGLDAIELWALTRGGKLAAHYFGDKVLIEHDALAAFVQSLPTQFAAL